MLRILPLLVGIIGCEPDHRVHVHIGSAALRATVSDRFLSVAIDTAQVVGGNFWTPGQTENGGSGPVPLFDFTRARLLTLAAPLGHAYLRIGGTDADRTFYAIDGSPPTTAPSGYAWILTRAQVDAAMAFAAALDLQIVFTLNAGRGPRNGSGAWTPDNARELVRYATHAEAPVVAWELGNEVNAYNLVLGFSLSATDYAADVRAARALLLAEAPGARLAAPASAYWPLIGEIGGLLPSFLQVGGDAIDLVTWHYYPQESARCPAVVLAATPTLLLDSESLDEIDRWADEVEAARAGGAPQAATWLGETSNAQCGGAPGISDAFVSSLWWLDELGKMARRGTQVVIRQSLTGADYGLLSEPSLDPRPDYFASVLWRRLMGAKVLAATVTRPLTLRVYAHCAASEFPPGAVTALLINLDDAQPITVALDGISAGARELYLVDAESLQAPRARLGGRPLVVNADGSLPSLAPLAGDGETVVLPPASYAFVVFPHAGAAACR
jgi:heparanase 1